MSSHLQHRHMLNILRFPFFSNLWQTHLKRSEKDASLVKSEKRLLENLGLCSEDKREGALSSVVPPSLLMKG